MKHPTYRQPKRWILVIAAPLLWIAITYLNIRIQFKEFDLDPGWVSSLMIMKSLIPALVAFPCTLMLLSWMRDKCFGGWLRILIALSPVLLTTLPGVFSTLISPMRRSVEFKERMGTAIPDDAFNLQAWYSHSSGESSYMFAFQCSARSTESILAANTYEIVENPSMLDPELGQFYQLPIGGMSPPKGWPQPKSWKGIKTYSSEVPGGYRYLLTDADKSRVFILVGDT